MLLGCSIRIEWKLKGNCKGSFNGIKMNEPFPDVPPTLLLALEQLFPNQCPSLKDGNREIWFKCGQRSVVEFLKNKLTQQQKDRSK